MIDLHVHSTISDGTLTPAQLAQKAKATGMEGLAITDHDCILGTDEARQVAHDRGLKFINGMEASSRFHSELVHIVCLGFDEESPAFQSFYRILRRRKEETIPDAIEIISKQGVAISVEEVQSKVTSYLDCYAIMRTMLPKFPDHTAGELWKAYIRPALEKLGAYADTSAEEVIAAVKTAGGVTSLAHFHKAIGLKNFPQDQHEKLIRELMDMGMDGMEAYYPNYSESNLAFAHYMIKKYDMVPTGGTDYHGGNRKGVELGTGINGNMNVPLEFMENIAAKCHVKL